MCLLFVGEEYSMKYAVIENNGLVSLVFFCFNQEKHSQFLTNCQQIELGHICAIISF